jgi:hypothetical protein
MTPVVLLASILGLFIGLAVTFFGERIFNISLSSTGFGVGFVLAGGIAFNVTEQLLVALVAGGIAGVISLFVVRSAYRSGLFLIGFAMSAILVTYISIAMDAVTIDIQNLENIDPNAIQQMLPLIGTGFFASMITGALVVMFDTPILRVLTAIFGAIVFAISGFILTTGMDTLPQTTAQLVGVPLFAWGGGAIPLAFAGIVFQFFGVNWLFSFLQIDQASRQKKARQQTYTQQQPSNYPPPQGNPQQPYGQQPPSGQQPLIRRPPSQGNPQQPYRQQPPSQRNPQQRQSPPRQQPPRKPRP